MSVRSRFSVPPSVAQYSGNESSCNLQRFGVKNVTVGGVTIIGSDRGENYNFSNGQEINHKCGNEGKKQHTKGTHSK